MRHFAAAEAQRDFGFVSFFEEAHQISQFDLVIAFVGAGAKLDLLDDDLLLLELGLVPLLAFAVLELAVIHDPANWRHRRRRDFDQIEFRCFRLRIGDRDADNADLLAIGADQPDFGHVNFAVNARLFFLSYIKTPLYQKVMPRARAVAPRVAGAR